MNGRGNVYFQPPADIRLTYPCLIYSLSDYYTRHADDKNYIQKPRYHVLVIHTDPDSTIAEDILREIPHSSFDRRYIADNLYHDSITIYW